MRIVIIVLVFLFSTAYGFLSNECYRELSDVCRPETKKTCGGALESFQSGFPPMTDALMKQDLLCQNLIKCTNQVGCSKNYTQETILDYYCCSFGSKKHMFDEYCMERVLEEIYNGHFECTKQFDFMIRSGVMNRSVFVEAKDCVLSVAKSRCQTEDSKFFDAKYDELMGIYTTKPEEKRSLCISPYDKFYKMQCEKMNLEAKGKLRNVTFLYWTDDNIQNFVRDCKDIQKCTEEKCDPNEKDKEEIKRISESLENFSSDLKATLEKHPYIMKYKCSEKINLLLVASGYSDCKNSDEKKKKNCVKSAIAGLCQKDILDEFGDN